jgi:hypothetical protein
MTEDDEKRYADLVEICARVIAFYELTETAIPAVTTELQVEAGELAGGWKDFDPDRPRSEQDLPIVDMVSDQIFERANELRRGLFGMRRKPAPLRH